MTNARKRLSQALAALIGMPAGFMLYHLIVSDGYHISKYEIGAVIGVITYLLVESVRDWKNQ